MKKYYIRHKWLTQGKRNGKVYFGIVLEKGACGPGVYLKSEVPLKYLQFTKEEIERIKKSLNTSFADFEIIEVEKEELVED